MLKKKGGNYLGGVYIFKQFPRCGQCTSPHCACVHCLTCTLCVCACPHLHIVRMCVLTCTLCVCARPHLHIVRVCKSSTAHCECVQILDCTLWMCACHDTPIQESAQLPCLKTTIHHAKDQQAPWTMRREEVSLRERMGMGWTTQGRMTLAERLQQMTGRQQGSKHKEEESVDVEENRSARGKPPTAPLLMRLSKSTITTTKVKQRASVYPSLATRITKSQQLEQRIAASQSLGSLLWTAPARRLSRQQEKPEQRPQGPAHWLPGGPRRGSSCPKH